MGKLTKKERSARIQRSVTGLLIPLTQITALYRFLEQEIDMGADEEKLAQSAKNWIFAHVK